MKFRHRDGERSANAISLGPVRDRAAVDADGIFAIDDDRPDAGAVAKRLLEAGHEPLEELPEDFEGEYEDEGEEEDSEQDGGNDGDEGSVPMAGLLTETEIAKGLSYAEKQAVAKQYDHIAGNASDDKLTEELIKQSRMENAE
jgi:hypothetical protein